MDIVIHHNPACGTSRNVLAVIKAAGYQPFIVDYLQTGWTEAQLRGLFAASNLTARQALRLTKSPAKELGLDDPSVSNDQLIEMMVLHPVLVDRPFVCTAKGVRLCRPSEKVLELLDRWPAMPFYKEDGSVLIAETATKHTDPQ